jgi:peptidoglycan hydrolase-like protein with peptidoglycan-binding domain
MRITAPSPARERARSAPTPASPGPQVLAGAGNRAVTAWVQRQAVETAPLLSSGQAAAAVAFYTGRPALYPPDVVAKIQRAVGSPDTGVPDQAMAQAVAAWQLPQGLKQDGMAGPRTLPRMFETGLATKEARAAYVKTTEDVQSGWKDLATAQARADELFKGVKTRLDAAQVAPTPKHEVKDLGKVAGVFVPKDWTMFFDDDAFSAADLDDDAARSVAGTVYHEARHAEQNHKMARMLATKGNSPEQIHAKMGIPVDVAQNAFEHPLPKGVEFATASQQFDSVYGAGKAQHDKAEREAPSVDELREAKAALDANPTPANKARHARLVAAFRAYHDLPTENDAFGTEAAFEESWDEKHLAP